MYLAWTLLEQHDLVGASARAVDAPPTPTQREQLARWLRRATAESDPAASAAWIHGRALSADEAIAQANAVQTSLEKTVMKPQVVGARAELVHSA